MLKIFVKLYVFIWKLRAKYGTVAIIENNVLRPRGQRPEINLPKIRSNLGTEMIRRLNATLDKNGDFDVLTNGYFVLDGTTSSVGAKTKTLSRLIWDSKVCAAALYDLGLRKGQMVHILLPNSTENHNISVGAWLCEAVVSLSDPNLTETVIQKQLDDTQANFIICCTSNQKTIYKVLNDMNALERTTVIVLDKAIMSEDDQTESIPDCFHSYKEIMLRAENKPQPPLLQNGQLQDDDTVLIFWSSGTTGLPKGIQHTFRAFRYMISSMEKRSSGNIGKALTTTCFFHAGGFATPFDNLVKKTPVVFNHGADIEHGDTCETLYREIDLFKPKRLTFGSHHMVQLSQTGPRNKKLDLSSVLFASPMGSTVPRTLYEDLKKDFKSMVCIAHGYGFSESYTVLALTFDLQYLGVIGPDIYIKLVDPETDKICGPEEIGEVFVKGGVPMKGYLNRPEENAKFFAGDGWYRTGDLARYNQRGMLFYEGRFKELIKYKNCHLYPLEIEKIICEHPEVIEAGVFGTPDLVVQELVTAAVVKTPGSGVTSQEIIDLVEKRVDDIKKLRGGVIFVDALPKNPVGKIQRRKLIDLSK